MRRRRPSLYLLPAILLALLFVAIPSLPLEWLPPNIISAWDGLVAVIRTPVTQFWWQYVRGADQQPLFNTLTYLTMVAILVIPWIAIRLYWIRRQRAFARFR